MGNENKVRFGILGNEMGFEFLGVFNTPYPTPRPPLNDSNEILFDILLNENENDFENGILEIPSIIFNNNFGFEMLFGGFEFFGVLSPYPTPHTIFNENENENHFQNINGMRQAPSFSSESYVYIFILRKIFLIF